MTRILVAMEREAEALGLPCEVIGIGGTDIPKIDEDDIIVNVGYCGGYRVPVGTVCEPWVSASISERKAIQLSQHFKDECDQLPCFTSDTFVTKPAIEYPSVYDMELWKLTQVPCKALYVLKIVSDNLDKEDCEQFNDTDAWEQVRRLLIGAKLL